MENDELVFSKKESWDSSLLAEAGENPVKGKFCRASIYVGVKLDTLLYSITELRKGLGILTGSEVHGANSRITKKLVRNFFDAAAINVFSSAYATFELKTGPAFPSWGTRHKTYVAYDAHKSFGEICEFLYSGEFKIGQGTYIISPNSVRERRARRGIKTG